MTEQPARSHPAVDHPGQVAARRDLARYERRVWGGVSRVNDFAASHLGAVFGSVWMVWVFFIWPLIAQHLGTLVQAQTSYYAQSWIQLFALPLFVYIGNKLQRSADAQSEVMHQAMTHIATVSDENKQLIEANTKLTEEVHALTTQVHAMVSADKE
jgi:hypothetical protein